MKRKRISVLHSRYRLIALIAMTVIIQSVGEMFAFSDELSKIARGIIYAVAQYQYRVFTLTRITFGRGLSARVC